MDIDNLERDMIKIKRTRGSISRLVVSFFLLLLLPTCYAQSEFDHDLTGFLLNGIHSRLACDSCHKPTGFETSAKMDHSRVGDQCMRCHNGVQLL